MTKQYDNLKQYAFEICIKRERALMKDDYYYNMSLCQIRSDLLDDNTSIPVGNIFIRTNERLKYRWEKEDNFQIYYNNEWLDAYSIDFDFL